MAAVAECAVTTAPGKRVVVAAAVVLLPILLPPVAAAGGRAAEGIEDEAGRFKSLADNER
ncbi:MAG: hypothetical protein GY696_05460 [Gammaproteobacteria bacterium]|nr:hypothetical protein [Gammaproteobacteria bacterium]